MLDTNQGPLSGLVVLDVAGESGLFCGRMLAELGAETIKIEDPEGDAYRRRGPWLESNDGDLEASLYHLHYNVNKKGITLNLETEEGRGLFRKLSTVADIIIETATPGEFDSKDIGYEKLSRDNPSLLYTTITPYGQTGERRHWKGNALTTAAMSGLLYLNGLPEEPPNQPAAEQSYHMASLVGAWGTLIALQDRFNTGQGSRIDVSIQEAASMATVQTANPNFYTWHKQIPTRGGMRHFGSRHLYLCKDHKWVSISIRPVRWTEFVQWLKEEEVTPDLTGDKWLDPFYRRDHQDAIELAHADLAGKYNRDELVDLGQSKRMLMVPVNQVNELSEHTQLRERGFFQDVTYEEMGRVLEHPGPAYQFSKTTPSAYVRAPRVGEHNSEIFAKYMKFDDADLRSLRDRGVI